MPIEIQVPPLGESITEATVGEWLKKVGDTVSPGEALVGLDTEKVNVEVSADGAGTLEEILARPGDTVKVGDVLCRLSTDGAAASPSPADWVAEAPPAVHSAGPPAEPASSYGSPEPGVGPLIPEGSVGDTSQHEEKTRIPQPGGEAAPTSPSARRLAVEAGVDLSQVAGAGPGGRIGREDVERAAGGVQPPSAQPAAPGRPSAPPNAPGRPTAPPTAGHGASPSSTAVPAGVAGNLAGGRPEEHVRLSRRRQTIARRLVEAQQTAAILTTFNEVDLTAVMDIRKRRKEKFQEQHGVGLGFMSFFTRAVVGALKAFPAVNAELQGDELILKHYYDIGIAVAAPEGLVVPVLRDADRRSFAQIESEIADLAKRARANTLTLQELMGGTFTITNGGTFGSLLSTPILNPPQVGILGMHKIQERPMAVGGQVVIRPMMYVALSYDHRVVDGREAVQFLVRVKELIEDPETLLLEG